VQNITIAVKLNTVAYDTEDLLVFTRKNRGSFAYNADFILAEEMKKGQLPN
jgi:hypothetical protein